MEKSWPAFVGHFSRLSRKRNLVRIRYTQNNYLTILKRKNTEQYRAVFFKDNRTKSLWETRVVSYMWLRTEVRVPKNSVDKELIWMAISGKQ